MILPEFNPGSPKQLQTLLYGGVVKTKVTEPKVNLDGNILLTKKGEMKLHTVIKEHKIKGLVKTIPKKTPTGQSSTDDEALQIISSWFRDDQEAIDLGIAHQQGLDTKQIVNLILKIRGLQKEISTYYDSTEELTYDIDKCVHAQFAHVATDTGRLGCRSPNVQNQPKIDAGSRVKEHFTSRYENGVLLSADYNQLEVVVQAQLSKDQGFINDVINKVDFHLKKVAILEGVSYEEAFRRTKELKDPEWISKRSKAKGFTFARAYGAGAQKISSNTGLSIDEVKDLIQIDKETYPQLDRYQTYLKEMVERQGYYQMFTGRRYNFKKYPCKFEWQLKRGQTESYSPTEIVNYCIQGTGTADIVLIMLGKFWRQKALLNRDNYLMINTIHDSLMLDCQQEFVEEAKKDLQFLAECRTILKEEFNYDLKVPIEVEVSEGNTWFAL